MIEVRDLTFTYPSASEATLHGLSFSIEDQEIFGFLGPSGAGKSTTQKILIGLLAGYGGRAEVLGREVRDWGQDLYERIGVSFELPNHYQRLTARENLEHFAALFERKAVAPLEALTWVGLADDADKRVSDFSKGMKIRLNVARSLLHGPKVLLLDEPTSGLDPVNARNVKDLVLVLRDAGATVVLTTHDMGVAGQLCDRVAFITDGRIREIDSPAALERAHGKRTVKVEYRSGEDTAIAEFDLDGLADNADYVELLRTQHIETMHSQETTLEQVFIEVTGQELAP